jgi:hypothetical protein
LKSPFEEVKNGGLGKEMSNLCNLWPWNAMNMWDWTNQHRDIEISWGIYPTTLGDTSIFVNDDMWDLKMNHGDTITYIYINRIFNAILLSQWLLMFPLSNPLLTWET